MKDREIKRSDLIHPELSYKIVGALFDVSNTLGGGHMEKFYQRAVAYALRDKGLQFQEQISYPVTFHGQSIGRQRLDFLVENRVILEIKAGDRFRRPNLVQVTSYLRISGLQLAILANFTRDGVLFRRLVNKS